MEQSTTGYRTTAHKHPSEGQTEKNFYTVYSNPNVVE